MFGLIHFQKADNHVSLCSRKKLDWNRKNIPKIKNNSQW